MSIDDILFRSPEQYPARIVLDIETSPTTALVFNLYNTNIGPDQVLKETSVMSVVIHDLDTTNRWAFTCVNEADPYDDAALMRWLHPFIDAAEVVVAHNAKFDIPLIYGRFFEHRLPPVKKPRQICTLKMAKSVGKFYSNRLAYLTRNYKKKKDTHGKYPGITLWKACLAGDAKAWRAMLRYNNRDVAITKRLFWELLPYSSTTLYTPVSDRPVCPKCGGHKLEKRGFCETAVGSYQRYRCADCGGWSQSRHTSRDRAVAAATLKGV